MEDNDCGGSASKINVRDIVDLHNMFATASRAASQGVRVVRPTPLESYEFINNVIQTPPSGFGQTHPTMLYTVPKPGPWHDMHGNLMNYELVAVDIRSDNSTVITGLVRCENRLFQRTIYTQLPSYPDANDYDALWDTEDFPLVRWAVNAATYFLNHPTRAEEFNYIIGG